MTFIRNMATRCWPEILQPGHLLDGCEVAGGDVGELSAEFRNQQGFVDTEECAPSAIASATVRAPLFTAASVAVSVVTTMRAFSTVRDRTCIPSGPSKTHGAGEAGGPVVAHWRVRIRVAR